MRSIKERGEGRMPGCSGCGARELDTGLVLVLSFIFPSKNFFVRLSTCGSPSHPINTGSVPLDRFADLNEKQEGENGACGPILMSRGEEPYEHDELHLKMLYGPRRNTTPVSREQIIC